MSSMEELEEEKAFDRAFVNGVLERERKVAHLLAPYRASHRETISAMPPYCALWGFQCLNMANWVRYRPFSEWFPRGEQAKWRCDTPPTQKGYLSDTCAIPYENKAKACDTPLCDTISKGHCAIWGGGISHWAAKVAQQEELEKQKARQKAIEFTEALKIEMAKNAEDEEELLRLQHDEASAQWQLGLS